MVLTLWSIHLAGGEGRCKCQKEGVIRQYFPFFSERGHINDNVLETIFFCLVKFNLKILLSSDIFPLFN